MTFAKPVTRGTSGSVLLITVFIAGLLGLTLGSYLLLVRSEAVATARSQAWNTALPAAGAGVEEALAYLNSTPVPASSWSSGMRTFIGSNTNCSYSVSAVPTNGGNYVITSTGYVTVPTISATLSRAVQVTTASTPLFNASLAAKSNLTLAYSGSFATTSPTPRRTNDGLAMAAGILDIAFRTLTGDVWLGPTAQFGANEEVKNVTGTIHNDFNADFPIWSTPSTTGWNQTAASANITNGSSGGTQYRYAFQFPGNNNYSLNSLNGSIYVAPGANITLVTQNDANINSIYIAGTGNNAGSLTIYMGGTNFSLMGKVTVENQSATNLLYFGSAANTNVTLNLGDSIHGPITTNFSGAFYASAANILLNDGYETNVSYSFNGAITAQSITQIGKLQFHFDDNLKRSGPRRRYVLGTWQEF